ARRLQRSLDGPDQLRITVLGQLGELVERHHQALQLGRAVMVERRHARADHRELVQTGRRDRPMVRTRRARLVGVTGGAGHAVSRVLGGRGLSSAARGTSAITARASYQLRCRAMLRWPANPAHDRARALARKLARRCTARATGEEWACIFVGWS